MGWINLVLPFLKMWWKPILGAVVVGFLYWKVSGFIDDYQEMKADHKSELQAKNDEIRSLTVQRNNARIEAESAKSALEEKEKHEERLELLLTDAITRQDDIRKDKRTQQQVFEGHDLEEMAKRHNEWIEKLANKASQERMDDFENAFNN